MLAWSPRIMLFTIPSSCHSLIRASLSRQVVVTIGVAIASYGEINFVVIGVILQLISIIAEALRLSLVQVCVRSPSSPCSWSACILPACKQRIRPADRFGETAGSLILAQLRWSDIVALWRLACWQVHETASLPVSACNRG